MRISMMKQGNNVKKSLSEQIVHGIALVVFTAVAFSYLYLIFWCIHSGMRTNSSIATKPFGFGGYHIANYLEAGERVEDPDSRA